MSQCTVSVTVPIFQVEQYIERCAVSLFEQSYPRMEYVFVDDCTPDRSVGILREVASRYPERMPYIRIVRHAANLGPAAARQTGIRVATGEYLMFVDSDDWLEKNAVEESLRIAEASGADLIVGHFFRYFGNHVAKNIRPVPEDPRQYLLSVLRDEAWSVLWAKLWKTSVLKNHAYTIADGVGFGEDYLLLPQILRHVSKVVCSDLILYHYDQRNLSSSTHAIGDRTIDDLLKVAAALERLFAEDRYRIALERGIIKKMVIMLKEFCVSYSGRDAAVGKRIVGEMARRNTAALPVPERILYAMCRIGCFRAAKCYVVLMRRIKNISVLLK